jgi:hypothetical protein
MAERILALVTSRSRAESIAGDLTEQAAARGVIWFWSGVLRTAASLLWRDAVENPAPVAGLALLGLAVYVGIDLLFAGLDGAAFFAAAYRSGTRLQLDSPGWRIWFAVPTVASSLLIGRMLAHWAPSRELAACLIYAIVVAIYNLVPMLGDNGVFATFWCVVFVVAGAGWGRRRRLCAVR